jgi:hypothetical protein
MTERGSDPSCTASGRGSAPVGGHNSYELPGENLP